MKTAIIFIILLLSVFAKAQEKPFTQAEYVKRLYGLQKNPAGKAPLIEALRKRGIEFVLTDGIRGLTRTKGGNNDELKRVLEEVNRRRQNPEAAKLPPETEASQILAKATARALESVEEMPDFVVKQLIQRSYAHAGTGKYLENDTLINAVSYSTIRGEENKVLSVNGVLQENPKSLQGFGNVGGYTSVGEFVGFLSGVFRPESETKFTLLDTDLLRGRKALVWKYEITAAKANYKIAAAGSTKIIGAGYTGKIWVDRDNYRVLRFEMDATEIPLDYPVSSVHRVIDYDWVTISSEAYLLPISADVRLISREQSFRIESRNRSRFKNYQKYGTEVTIVESEDAPVEEPEK